MASLESLPLNPPLKLNLRGCSGEITLTHVQIGFNFRPEYRLIEVRAVYGVEDGTKFIAFPYQDEIADIYKNILINDTEYESLMAPNAEGKKAGIFSSRDIRNIYSSKVDELKSKQTVGAPNPGG